MLCVSWGRPCTTHVEQTIIARHLTALQLRVRIRWTWKMTVDVGWVKQFSAKGFATRRVFLMQLTLQHQHQQFGLGTWFPCCAPFVGVRCAESNTSGATGAEETQSIDRSIQWTRWLCWFGCNLCVSLCTTPDIFTSPLKQNHHQSEFDVGVCMCVSFWNWHLVEVSAIAWPTGRIDSRVSVAEMPRASTIPPTSKATIPTASWRTTKKAATTKPLLRRNLSGKSRRQARTVGRLHSDNNAHSGRLVCSTRSHVVHPYAEPDLLEAGKDGYQTTRRPADQACLQLELSDLDQAKRCRKQGRPAKRWADDINIS